jgi:hypothetical protein
MKAVISETRSPSYADLLVILVADVDGVDLDDPVTLLHPGCLCRTARVDLSNVLPRPGLLRVQVEAVAVKVRALCDRAVPRPGGVVGQLMVAAHLATGCGHREREWSRLTRKRLASQLAAAGTDARSIDARGLLITRHVAGYDVILC